MKETSFTFLIRLWELGDLSDISHLKEIALLILELLIMTKLTRDRLYIIYKVSGYAFVFPKAIIVILHLQILKGVNHIKILDK